MCVCLFCVCVNGSVFISLAVKFGLDLLTYTHCKNIANLYDQLWCVEHCVSLGYKATVTRIKSIRKSLLKQLNVKCAACIRTHIVGIYITAVKKSYA